MLESQSFCVDCSTYGQRQLREEIDGLKVLHKGAEYSRLKMSDMEKV